MRCSKCSADIKPVVAVDIDGTLGDYHSHFLTFAELWTGRALSTTDEFDGTLDGISPLPSHHHSLGRGDPLHPFRSWVMRHLDISEAEWYQIKLAYRQGGMKRSMPIFDGAAALCGAVREAGAELWLTTTRPYLRLDNVDPDTRAWLERHGIEYDGLLYDEEKYTRLAEHVEAGRVVFVLDDLLEQVTAARELFGESIPHMACGRYNREARLMWKGRGVSGLAEAQDSALRAITNWRGEHD